MDSINNKKEILTAFVLPIFYCKFPEFSKSNRAFRMFFMMLRYDNTIGLIGGKINKNEEIINGLKREAFEESLIELNDNNLIKINEFIEETNSHKIKSYFFCTNFSTLEIEEVKKIISKANLSHSSVSEGSIVAVHAYGKHYKKLRNKCNLAIGVGKELDSINYRYNDYVDI